MAAPESVVALEDKFEMVRDLWSPHIVAEFNGFHMKLARVEGQFQWHTHEETDEVFLVHSGDLTIELHGRDPVHLTAGDVFVVPAGLEHRPTAAGECEIVLIEPAHTPNTGDVDTATVEPWI